jgi:Nif-specific regulatory protein
MRDDQPNDKLLAILNISQKLNSERDLDTLLGLIARETARLLDAELSSLFLLDESGRELWSKITLDTNEVLRFDASEGIAGEAIRSGEVIRVGDVTLDDRFFAGVDARTGFQTRNLLAIPLRNLSGKTVGVFEVLNKRMGAFSDEDVELARLLAAQTTIALETAQLVGALRRDHDELLAANARLERAIETKFSTQNILGTSEAIRKVVLLIEQIADSSLSVLITGESGTGKELAAKALHYNSQRAHGPLISLNCAALPEALVESELFGIEKGVATGVEPRMGKFEAAQHGTLFLDEVGDLSLTAQAKVLRVLQERLVERVGGRRAIPVDVRLLSATNKDLLSAITAGSFREDLYYRLNAVQIRMPPLREIREDIPILANYLLVVHCRELNRSPPELTSEVAACLADYRWPGNVRELDNEIKRLAFLVRRDRVELADLPENIRTSSNSVTASGSEYLLKNAVEALERRMISAALEACHGNQQRAAQSLGVSRQGLIKKMKRHRIGKLAP